LTLLFLRASLVNCAPLPGGTEEMRDLGQLGSKPKQRYRVVLRARDGESVMKNGTVPPIGYNCPCTLHIYYMPYKAAVLRVS